LAGTCGVELRTPEGKRIDRVAYDDVRQVLDALKPHWLRLIAEREGFSLEDRLWTLALHARFADEDEAQEVWAAARRLTTEVTEGLPLELFRMPGGYKSLEITPKVAHKGRTVEYVLDRYPLRGALPVYFGENDEEVFGVVRRRGGIATLVSPALRKTKADFRPVSPQAVLYWLQTLPARLDQPAPLMAGEGR
jgi:trehalose-phosphatase